MKPPTYYLGTHMETWVERSDMPALFVTRNRFQRRKNWPKPGARLAIDSGAFSELLTHGRWSITPAEYAAFIEQAAATYGDRLDFVAPQDWLCLPDMVRRTGRTVEWHAAASVESVAELRALLPAGLRRLVLPVLQGYQPDDYRACGYRYADVGIDLGVEPRLTVGSLVRPVDQTPTVLAILDAACEFGRPFHTFGLKGDGLVAAFRRTAAIVGGEQVGMTSSDSTNWSYVARKRKIRLDGHTHVNCGNCREWALDWWGRQTDRLDVAARQMKAAA